jgi:hypothetical protein
MIMLTGFMWLQCSKWKSEVPAQFLKAKQGYTIRKVEKDKWM